jgi:hypothetical protein
MFDPFRHLIAKINSLSLNDESENLHCSFVKGVDDSELKFVNTLPDNWQMMNIKVKQLEDGTADKSPLPLLALVACQSRQADVAITSNRLATNSLAF